MDQKGTGTLRAGPARVPGPRPSLKAAAPRECAGGLRAAAKSAAFRWSAGTSAGGPGAWGSEAAPGSPTFSVARK